MAKKEGWRGRAEKNEDVVYMYQSPTMKVIGTHCKYTKLNIKSGVMAHALNYVVSRLRHEDHCKFKDSLNYIRNSGPP